MRLPRNLQLLPPLLCALTACGKPVAERPQTTRKPRIVNSVDNQVPDAATSGSDEPAPPASTDPTTTLPAADGPAAAADESAVAATDQKVLVYGRWGVVGSTYQTITNGAELDLRFAKSSSATLTFDVAGAVHRPGIVYWLDDGPATRVQLDESGIVKVTAAAAAAHTIRFIANIDSEYPVTHDDWSSRRDALKFVGATLDAGGAFMALTPNDKLIEFLGDSITASLRNNFTGTDMTSAATPDQGFPEKVCKALGFACIVTGHGGQGINSPSSDGAPRAVDAFGFVYRDTPWAPPVPPKIVVIYHGTNGSFNGPDYLAYLQKIRAAYPAAHIFCLSPHLVPDLSKPQAIQQAVVAMSDPKIYYYDYAGVISAAGTVDGIHPSAAGDTAIAQRIIYDINATIGTP